MALLAIVFYIRGNFTQTVNPDDPGPGFFPRSLCVLLFAAALTQGVVSWCKKRKKGKDRSSSGGKKAVSPSSCSPER